jgi:hypothetical protein
MSMAERANRIRPVLNLSPRLNVDEVIAVSS